MSDSSLKEIIVVFSNKLDSIIEKNRDTTNSLKADIVNLTSNLQTLIIAVNKIKEGVDEIKTKKSGKTSASTSTTSTTTTTSNGTPKKPKNINNSFKELFTKDRELAIKLFGIEQSWIDEVEKYTSIRSMTDIKKKNNKIAGEIWSTYFNDEKKKESAKDAYNKYVESTTPKESSVVKNTVNSEIPDVNDILTKSNIVTEKKSISTLDLESFIK